MSTSMLTAPMSLPDSSCSGAGQGMKGTRGPAVGQEQLPGAAPFAAPERGPVAPKFGGVVVVIGEPPGGVGRVDGGGQGIEQFAEPAFALAQRCSRAQQIGRASCRESG